MNVSTRPKTDEPNEPNDEQLDALADVKLYRLSEEEREEAEAIAERIEYWDGVNETIVEAERDALTALVNGDDDAEFDALADIGLWRLSAEEREEAEAIAERIEYWDGLNETIVEAEADALADLVGEDVDLEVV